MRTKGDPYHLDKLFGRSSWTYFRGGIYGASRDLDTAGTTASCIWDETIPGRYAFHKYINMRELAQPTAMLLINTNRSQDNNECEAMVEAVAAAFPYRNSIAVHNRSSCRPDILVGELAGDVNPCEFFEYLSYLVGHLLVDATRLGRIYPSTSQLLLDSSQSFIQIILLACIRATSLSLRIHR